MRQYLGCFKGEIIDILSINTDCRLAEAFLFDYTNSLEIRRKQKEIKNRNSMSERVKNMKRLSQLNKDQSILSDLFELNLMFLALKVKLISYDLFTKFK